MRKLNLILGIYFGGIAFYSIIFDERPTDRFLFMEVNIWIKRLFYLLGGLGFLYGYYKSKDAKTGENE